jgi:hypothetical protein
MNECDIFGQGGKSMNEVFGASLMITIGLITVLLIGGCLAEYTERKAWCKHTHNSVVKYEACLKNPDWKLNKE